MSETHADIARRAAAELAPEVGSALPALVEARLAGAPEQTDRYADPSLVIAFAGLLVNAAALAWSIYRDLKKDAKAAPAREALARQVRVRIEVPPGMTAAHRDRAITVVVEEVFRAKQS